LGVPREAAYASATILPYDDTDIPIAMHADNVACILYIFTKRGLVSAHDLPTGKLLFAHKVLAPIIIPVITVLLLFRHTQNVVLVCMMNSYVVHHQQY
jgi:hypothetical protein